MDYDVAAIARAELRFREGIWRNAPSDAVAEQSVRHRRFGPLQATLFAGLPKLPILNMIQGAEEPGAVEGGHLAEAVEWVSSWEVDYLVSVLADRPGTGGAETWLLEHGYEQGAAMRRYIRPASSPTPAGAAAVEVRKLAPGDTEEMSFICAEALDVPDLATVLLIDLPEPEGWRCYAAFLEGREVACGAMLTIDGIAMLGLDGTRPEARRGGCQSALLHRRLLDAAGAGCHTVLAVVCDIPGDDAGASGNLLRAGFVEAGRRVSWRPAMGPLG